MEKDNWMARIRWMLRNEPVRLAEQFRVLLFALPIVLNVTLEDARLTAASTVVSVLISAYASMVTRKVVSPVAKAKEDLTYDSEFIKMEEEYA